ncbi:MAG: RuBisCO accumulation factor 1 [Cyanobacteria bacterium P01_D01_bin.123]
MTESHQQPFSDADEQEQDIDTDALIRQLRRKEGTWIEWGVACQALRKAGMSQLAIFEATGFEATHQNQVVVGAQVFAALTGGASPSAISHFQRKGSDILYECRVLDRDGRLKAAELVVDRQLDFDDAREVIKALQDYARFGQESHEFEDTGGDAVAYYYWRLARQSSDLQSRSRLIANGLKFATSDRARSAIEKLLIDFTVPQSRPAPRLPLYRLESESELPRVVPVVGQLPLTKADLQAIPVIDEATAFRIVKFQGGAGAWVALPGWQVVLGASDPIAVLATGADLPAPGGQSPSVPVTETVLVVVDRDRREWADDSYFIVEADGHLAIQWFDTEPDCPLLGRVVLILRPKKILDENYISDPWQTDE